METPETSADLMSQVLARIGGSGRALEFRVFEAYSGAVGEMLRLRTEPERLNGKTLQVRVASSALAHELTMLKREVLDRMALAIGDDVVTDLRTRVGGYRRRGVTLALTSVVADDDPVLADAHLAVPGERAVAGLGEASP